jgi:hypothetical protein
VNGLRSLTTLFALSILLSLTTSADPIGIINLARCTRYNFPWYIFFSELRQDDSLLRVLRFLQTIKLIDQLVPIDRLMTWNVYQTGWYGSCERVHVIIKHGHYNTIYALTFLLRWESQKSTERSVIGTNWPLLSWSIGSWISDYMCKQCQSPLTLWAWIPLMARCTRYNFPWYICFSELRQDDRKSTERSVYHKLCVPYKQPLTLLIFVCYFLLENGILCCELGI